MCRQVIISLIFCYDFVLIVLNDKSPCQLMLWSRIRLFFAGALTFDLASFIL